ncbi:hypothetical protein GCM10017744_042430 [Streptomyces antimycoticus]|uniref:Uncharacterized protein n=1 Tax=Streptomyces antimycoticus TaxID=68175 RepID=A0A4D4KEA9_9ACTN|nr:hypothetical protein SSPO_040380 [Streptomyces antimycoticus]GDY45116.1 hypothetical protein SANT12839_059980 [Streptomyces antimycoticus]
MVQTNNLVKGMRGLRIGPGWRNPEELFSHAVFVDKVTTHQDRGSNETGAVETCGRRRSAPM